MEFTKETYHDLLMNKFIMKIIIHLRKKSVK